MERSVTNNVVTEAFFLTSNSVRSRIHFFPSAGVTAGHYPVVCELTLFGKGIETRAVRIDGGRLNQPDGIRLEEVFPSLATETSGVAGLQIRLEASQGRLNLLSSRVFIEMVSPQFSLAFCAAPFRAGTYDDDEQSEGGMGHELNREAQSILGIATQDRYSASSLVAVNASSDLLRPKIQHVLRDAQAPLQMGTVAASSVVEFSLEEPVCRPGITHETLWGNAVLEKFWIEEPDLPTEVSWYLLTRDPVSKRPISVCAL